MTGSYKQLELTGKIARTSILMVFLMGTTAALAQYQQSPALDDQVASGALPPVEERLPGNPVVITPLDEVGTYGGTLTRGTAWLGDYVTENFTREPLINWQVPITNAGPPVANLATSWVTADDGLSVNVTLREGVKWSDGEPFTSEDVAFYWNEIMLDENVTRSVPGILKVDGEIPGFEVVGPLEVKFTFPRPYLFFDEAHASIWEIAWPKHYMSQFHPTYNSSSTYEDLNTHLSLQSGRGKVTLQAWMLDEYVEGDFYNLVRNPYYWKVDTDGNQLPYFDNATIDLVEDRQTVALGLVTGEYDLDAMWVGIQHIGLFSEAIESGRDVSLTFADFQGMAMYFNMDISDAAKKAAFRDVSFRRALSLSINRQEVSDVFYSGLLIPGNSGFNPVLPYSDEEQLSLWASYDPTQANAMLDAAGYMDVTDDGFREAPDGSALEIIIDVGQHDLYTGIVELMVNEYLPDIGIKTIMNVGDQSAIRTKYHAGDFEMHVWDYEGSGYPLAGNLDELAPVAENLPPYHPNWKDDPESQAFLSMGALMRGATGVDYEQRVKDLTQASRLFADNAWIIHLGYFQRPFLKSTRLGNAPDRITRNDQVNDMPAWGAEQLFAR